MSTNVNRVSRISSAPYRPLRSSSIDSDSGSERDAGLEERNVGAGAGPLDARTQAELLREADAHVGVKKVEAATRVYGPYSKWILFISLGLASYIYSLDGSTTYNYLAFAASSFGEHALIATIQVAQSVIIAVGKPVIAKVADVTSRAYAYLGVLIFYVVGYIVIASAQNVGTIGGGIVVYAVGYTGLQLLTQIIIADSTTLKWRGLVSSLVSMPFVVNGFIGPNIATSILEHSGWRWGYGMFAILVPATLSPLIITLFWAERKAKRLGIVENVLSDAGVVPSKVATKDPDETIVKKTIQAAEQLDLVGLILLGASVSLILLPLTLAQGARGQWKNPSIIAMLVVGIVLLFVFALWDLRFAKRPVIAPRFVRNPSVVLASLIGFFDFMSFYLTTTYLLTFVIVVKPWSLLNVTYFMQTQTVALTVFGFAGGVIMWFFRRYKYILVIGLLIRLLGVGLMIHSRGANASTVELVWTQILQGMGGGFAASASQVGAQASVPHVDVAMVTAAVLLLTEIGGAIGSAIAGAIWSNSMPTQLAKHLPSLSSDQIAQLFGDIELVLQYPRGSDVREGVIAAYDDTMKTMVIVATALSVVPVLFSVLMPNWYLGDTQNAVDDADLAGERAPGNPDEE